MTDKSYSLCWNIQCLPACLYSVRPKAGKKDEKNLRNFQEQNSHSPVVQAVAYSVYLIFSPALHSMNICMCIFCFVSFYVLFVCKCVLYYCHWVTTQLQLTNISYHIITLRGPGMCGFCLNAVCTPQIRTKYECLVWSGTSDMQTCPSAISLCHKFVWLP